MPLCISIVPTIDKFKIAVDIHPASLIDYSNALRQKAVDLGIPIKPITKGIGSFVRFKKNKLLGFDAGIRVVTYYGVSRFVAYELSLFKNKAVGVNALSEFSNDLFGAHFGHPIAADFRSALEFGRIQQYEVALDVLNLRCSDFLVHLKGSSLSRVEEGSQYSGSSSSEYQVKMYDKTDEQISAGLQPGRKCTLRIELTHRPFMQKETESKKASPTMTVERLRELQSPFRRVRVYDLQVACALVVERPKEWASFLLEARATGVASALRIHGDQQNGYSRKRLSDLLELASAWWFRPHKKDLTWKNRINSTLLLSSN